MENDNEVDEEKKNGITEIAGNNEMDEQQREKTAGSIELILCHGSISWQVMCTTCSILAR